MTTWTYEEVSSRGRKSGPCEVCGKPATRSRTFTNTVNPWNRNPDGTVRTRAEVWAHVNELRHAWEAQPVLHERCEP